MPSYPSTSTLQYRSVAIGVSPLLVGLLLLTGGVLHTRQWFSKAISMIDRGVSYCSEQYETGTWRTRMIWLTLIHSRYMNIFAPGLMTGKSRPSQTNGERVRSKRSFRQDVRNNCGAAKVVFQSLGLHPMTLLA